LHVPLRLDVYYQHTDGQRELLERWCLEYAPFGNTEDIAVSGTTATTTTVTAAPSLASPDPIVQLRLVCKNIVIWLRTLYCWSRMLPAQALRKMTLPTYLPTGSSSSPIGFSIYVVSEGQDDVSSLVSDRGFHSQGQPHSVPTPYGELGWKVFFAPKDVVQRLMPTSSSSSLPYPNYVTGNVYQSRSATKTRPIPMNPHFPHQLQQHHQHQELDQQQSYKTARSAPQHGGQRMYYRRANSAIPPHAHDTTDDKHDSTANALLYTNPTVAPRSYHHQRHHYLHQAHKAQSSDNVEAKQQLQQQLQVWQQLNPLREELQSFSVPVRVKDVEQQPLKIIGNNGGGGGGGGCALSSKTKSLSGLSLALMLSDEQSLSLNSADAALGVENGGDTMAMDVKDNREGKNGEKTVNAETIAASEKRRAALHNAPPQFNNASNQNHPHLPAGMTASPGGMGAPPVATTAGEYGYAYNNHIPTLQLHQYGRGVSNNGSKSPLTPNTNNTSMALGLTGPQFPTTSSYNTSPSLRPMTPSLGSTPPGYLLSATPSTGMMTGPITPNSVGSGGLIPPRSSVTPPFVRPMGFVGEASSHPVPSPAALVTATDEGTAVTVGTDKVTATGSKFDPDAVLQQHQTSLDLLHSSPFQHPPPSHSFYSLHANTSLGSRGQQQQQHHRYYQSSEHYAENGFGAAPFLSEFYHRSGNLTDDIHDRGNSEAFLDHDLSDDMPFAVDPIIGTSSSAAAAGTTTSSGGVAVASHQNATTGLASMMNEASLMASMCTVTPKRLAMFDSKLVGDEVGSQKAIPVTPGAAGDGICDVVMDSLADQLADFKSFGASLLVTSTAGGMGTANSPFAPEAPTASAGSG
jgi:hypothetical protein